MANQRNEATQNLLVSLNGEHVFQGIITATGTAKDNSNTSTPFTLTAGMCLLVQPDADCYILGGASSGITAGATGNGLKLVAGTIYTLMLRAGTTQQTLLSAVTDSGTVNLKVWNLQ